MSRTISSRTPASPTPVSPVTPTRRAALLSALALPLAACTGGPADRATSTSTASDSTASDSGTSAGQVTVTDPWVKAAETGMTAAFGTVVNGTGRDLTLVSASTPASSEVQLHETTSDGSGGMSMKEKEGGFEIPAGGQHVLEPGGDHIMLMALTRPLLPGDEVEVTLQFDDGTSVPLTATVKDFTGAQEHYAPGEGHASPTGDDAHSEASR